MRKFSVVTGSGVWAAVFLISSYAWADVPFPKGAVATPHALASKVGEQMLEQGKTRVEGKLDFRAYVASMLVGDRPWRGSGCGTGASVGPWKCRSRPSKRDCG